MTVLSEPPELNYNSRFNVKLIMKILKIEDVFNRFPHINESIINELGNQSLINCKEASRELSKLFEQERFFWIRILRNYSKHYQTFHDFWKMATNRTSIEIVKHLAVATKTSAWINQRSRFQFNPIHVAIEAGNMELLEHILKKLREKIPSGSVMIIPPGNFMSAEIRSLISQYSMDRMYLRPYREQSKGSFGICRFMIGYVNDGNRQNIKVNYYDRKKLNIAVANSHVEIAKFLLTEKCKEKIIPRILEEHPFIWEP